MGQDLCVVLRTRSLDASAGSASARVSYDIPALQIAVSGSVVKLAGEIDLSSREVLAAQLRMLAASEPQLHVDLAQVTFCDVAGLWAILCAGGTRPAVNSSHPACGAVSSAHHHQDSRMAPAA